MKLSSAEKETMIVFNEGETTACVETFNGALKRKLQILLEERPNEVRLLQDYGNGCIRYEVPKKWIRLNATRVLSEAQKEARSISIKAAQKALGY